jgi:hypothetical protein
MDLLKAGKCTVAYSVKLLWHPLMPVTRKQLPNAKKADPDQRKFQAPPEGVVDCEADS